MGALPKLRHHDTPSTVPAERRERHLRLVEPAHERDEESRQVSQARWVAILVAVATAAFLLLSTASIYGAADEIWWWPLLALVLAGIVALGVVAIRKSG